MARAVGPAAFATITSISSEALADETGTVRVNPVVDISVTAAVGALLTYSELDKASLAPSECRWCDRDSTGQDKLNAVDREVRDVVKWDNATGTAKTLSNVTAFAVLPAMALGTAYLAAAHDGKRSEFWTDALVIIESSVMALGFSQLVKFSFGRERPYAHARTPEERIREFDPDDNVGFFSGHTATGFALYTSLATVATIRHRRMAPWIWAIGPVFAALPGYLRMAADDHYLTDVLVGGAIGTGFGIGIPLLFHSNLPALAVPAFAPTRGGGTVVFQGAF